MDFSDQIALGRPARRAAARGRARPSARSSGRAARRVPGHLGRPGADAARLFSGPDPDRPRPPGDRGRRPQPGDLRLARRVGVQHPRLRRGLPGAPTARDVADVPADGQPPLRRAASSRPPTTSPRRSTPASRQVRPLEPKPERRAGRGRAPPSTRRTTTSSAWLADAGDRRPRARWPTPSLARDRRADPRQRPRRRGVRRADRAPRSRSRSSASRACSGCPRWPRSWPRCTLVHDVTANAALLTLLTGPRWAIGPRDLALLGRRAARRWPGAAAGERPSRPRRRARRRGRPAPTRPRSPRCATRWSDPGDLRLLAEARERFALLAGELRRLRAPRRRAAARPGPPDHRHHAASTSSSPRRSAPRRRARRDNLDLFVKAVAEFQAVDGEVTLPALLA